MNLFSSKAIRQSAPLLLSLVTLSAVPQAAQAAQLSFSGSSSGQWGLPTAPTASTRILDRNGGNNNRLQWGQTGCQGCTVTNYVQFDGANFDAQADTLFSLGQLKYRNGSALDTFDGDFPLTVSLLFDKPAKRQQTFSFLFNVLSTPNTTGDPVKDGDRLRFSTAGMASQTVTFKGIEYTLQLVGFSTDLGRSIVQEFNSPEGETVEASLFGKITPAASACPFR